MDQAAPILRRSLRVSCDSGAGGAGVSVIDEMENAIGEARNDPKRWRNADAARAVAEKVSRWLRSRCAHAAPTECQACAALHDAADELEVKGG